MTSIKESILVRKMALSVWQSKPKIKESTSGIYFLKIHKEAELILHDFRELILWSEEALNRSEKHLRVLK